MRLTKKAMVTATFDIKLLLIAIALVQVLILETNWSPPSPSVSDSVSGGLAPPRRAVDTPTTFNSTSEDASSSLPAAGSPPRRAVDTPTTSTSEDASSSLPAAGSPPAGETVPTTTTTTSEPNTSSSADLSVKQGRTIGKSLKRQSRKKEPWTRTVKTSADKRRVVGKKENNTEGNNMEGNNTEGNNTEGHNMEGNNMKGNNAKGNNAEVDHGIAVNHIGVQVPVEKNEIGKTLYDASWTKAPVKSNFHVDDSDTPDHHPLIYRVTSTTSTVIHVSVYAYIGVNLLLLTNHGTSKMHLPMEPALMLAGVVLHSVAGFCLSEVLASMPEPTLHHNLTLALVILCGVMVTLMMADCALVVAVGRKPTTNRYRKPNSARNKTTMQLLRALLSLKC